MYCRNCGEPIDDNAAICVKCGFKKGSGNKYCQNCGKPTEEGQEVCMNCGHALKNPSKNSLGSDKTSMSDFKRSNDGKILAGVFAGAEKCFGINKWIGRIVVLFIPFWPLWLIGYIVAAVATPIED